MDSIILKKICSNQIYPSRLRKDERAKKNERAFEECFDRFIAKYGEEILPDLNELLDAQGYCSSDEAELYFAEAFKSGILLGLETAESMKRE